MSYLIKYLNWYICQLKFIMTFLVVCFLNQLLFTYCIFMRIKVLSRLVTLTRDSINSTQCYLTARRIVGIYLSERNEMSPQEWLKIKTIQIYTSIYLNSSFEYVYQLTDNRSSNRVTSHPATRSEPVFLSWSEWSGNWFHRGLPGWRR